MAALPVKAVLFDLDDTLWPIAPVIARAEILLHEWLGEHAPQVTAQFSIEQLRARRLAVLADNPHYRINLSALRHAVLSEAFQSTGADLSLVDGAMAVFLQARHAVTLFDDVLPTLARLQGRVALGSVSNGVADLDAIGLASYFTVSIAAHSFGVGKPDATIFHAACEALGVAPAETVYIGDDPELDVAGAAKAGLQAVWLNRGAGALPKHISAHAHCASLHELHAWLGERMLPLQQPG